MDRLIIHSYNDKPLRNAVALVGFPSIGLVSSIATNFLSRELKLDLVAGISSPEFPPYALVHNGIPMPPIRIYAGDRECEGGMQCDGLVVVTSEFMPKPELHHPLAMALLDWLQEHNVNTVVTLDGIPQTDDEFLLVGAGSTPAAREIMKKYEINDMLDGIVRGTSGVMLYEGANRGADVITIMGSAKMDMPDPRGAAKLMGPLSKMLPELKIDPEPLYREAEEIEKRMKGQAAPEVKELPRDQILYG